MRLRNIVAGIAHELASSADGAEGRAPADDQNASLAARVVNNDRINGAGDCVNLGLADAHHLVVVIGVVGDSAVAVGLLETSDSMLETLGAGHCPRASQGLGVTQVRPEILRAVGKLVIGLGREVRIDLRERRGVRNQPRLRAVGQVTVGEQEHRGAVLDGDAHCLDGREEAVTW